MVKFLKWAGAMALGTLNGFVKLFLAVVAVVIVGGGVALLYGDGLPKTAVLSLDLRERPLDSAPPDYVFGAHKASVMDILLGLDAAAADKRIKGIYVRLGTGELTVAQAEEIGAALKRFRAKGKFVIVHSQGFLGSGLGDYLTAAAGEVWMQPKAPFLAAGAGAGRLYLRGLFDKIGVVPQIAKRAEYKSAADTYTATAMSGPDREQISALLSSWYDTATGEAAAARKIAPAKIVAALEASPQPAEAAKKAGLVDHIGYDDDAANAALDRAGEGSEMVAFEHYVDVRASAGGAAFDSAKIALVEACGTIVDGRSNGSPLSESANIGGDDVAEALRQAAKDASVKAIVLRIDSPGGSGTASDQILDAVKKAQKAGKPVVVSMGSVAASGGYFIALSADRIVAQPATITGSIGVFTGKMSVGGALSKIGVHTEQIGRGRNALMQSPYAPYTADQWAAVNAEADAVYDDFTAKVAAGRKLPLAKVRDVARGRVWSGRDAASRGLVDTLGGFWTAVDVARKLGKIEAGSHANFVVYPRAKGLLETVQQWLGGASAAVHVLNRIAVLLDTPVVRETVASVREAPHGVELRAVGLPR